MPIPDSPDVVDVLSGRLLSDTVFDRISAAIVDGTIGEGEDLDAAALQRWLGVSQTPIREALSRLELAGLIETAPSRYTRVTSVDDELVTETLAFTGIMAGLSVRLALATMSDEELSAAVELVEGMIAADDEDDLDRLYAVSTDFVRYMVAHCGNRLVQRAMREAGIAVQRSLRARRPTLGTQAQRTRRHRDLRAAVAARDGERAEHVLRTPPDSLTE